MALSELERRNLVGIFCEQNPHLKKNEIFKHFHAMGFKKTFIYNAIKLFENKKSMVRKPGSGRKCALKDSKVRANLKQQTAGRSAKSYSELGRKFKVHRDTIKMYLTKMGVNRKAKKSAPKTTERQEAVIKARLKLLSLDYFAPKSTYICVMDDESYFTVEGNEWQQKHYYESKDRPAPDQAKFIRKTKFPAKVLLWLAVSERGISEPVFFKAGLAVNKEVYISKCLPILHKFIQQHHKNEKIVFWPDLASAHYAKDTLVRLEELKIEYVPKDHNPPNVPQLRPIENFWANLKRKVYSNNYRPKNLDCLIAKIRKELKSIETMGIRKAMKEVPQNVRKANKFGATLFCK